jgi:hypothetical protein
LLTSPAVEAVRRSGVDEGERVSRSKIQEKIESKKEKKGNA